MLKGLGCISNDIRLNIFPQTPTRGPATIYALTPRSESSIAALQREIYNFRTISAFQRRRRFIKLR
jgi:hypothetical protein